ncbi:heavy metal-binding domain-containing protein [Flavobacterium eburneipallidum]|uniref:heavy metal-binding domain-containing protein n=1 Tax=Flavobacterium eburneipallidum TaxID=3003263 RepID=UPI0022AC32A1|nr:heavy metal-binding domain-containing protein [Flavobacterium eburneipallidum]
MKKLIILISLVTIVSSCSTVSKIKTDDYKGSDLVPTNADNVEVYSTKTTVKTYKVIGQVVSCADAGQNAEVAVKLLKQQASLLGADAIIDMRLSIAMGYWSNGIKATGTAVKYN